VYPIKSLEPETETVVSVTLDSSTLLGGVAVEPPNSNVVSPTLFLLSPLEQRLNLVVLQ